VPQPILTVEVEGTLVPIQIDDPSRISIIRDGQIADDYQFTCGVQSGETLRVGFEPSSEGGASQFLRLLQFGELNLPPR
jgi:hypothetical protein